ncbi:unnamed protein product [Sphagnum jensenii]|uniref:Uncharacterized protein n=1 Tax=Sphagnum jensenii TaxID=128206 RepID=A0ABP1AUU9_9BRYO
MRQNLGGTTSHAQHNGNTFLCSTSKYSLFLQGPDGKLPARSGAVCEATRQWPFRNKPARRQAVNGPPALCWQEAEPSHASTCFRQRPATFPRRLQEPPCPLGLFIAQIPHDSFTRPGSPQTHVLTYVWIRTASTSRLVDCCRTLLLHLAAAL